MKIDKIQCDICGKIVDYNDTNDIVRLREEDRVFTTCSVEFMEAHKSNKLQLHGIMKTEEYPFLVINMEYDLCEECLLKLRDMILEMIDSNKVELSNYRKGVKLNEIH